VLPVGEFSYRRVYSLIMQYACSLSKPTCGPTATEKFNNQNDVKTEYRKSSLECIEIIDIIMSPKKTRHQNCVHILLDVDCFFLSGAE